MSGSLREELGEAYSADFQPPYAPWDQRLCLVPDSDFFNAVKGGRAAVVTGEIDRFEADGVRLRSGEKLPADHGMTESDIIIFSSGYLQRARSVMPKSAPSLPWRLNQDYLEDSRDFRKRPVDDGVLRFAKRATRAAA